MSIAEQRFADILAEHGETMTLRRLVPGDPPTWIDVTVKGKRRAAGGGADPLAGTLAQQSLRIVISNREITAASWPGPPRKDDVLTIDGRDYALTDDADTRKDGETILGHFLIATGS